MSTMNQFTYNELTLIAMTTGNRAMDIKDAMNQKQAADGRVLSEDDDALNMLSEKAHTMIQEGNFMWSPT